MATENDKERIATQAIALISDAIEGVGGVRQFSIKCSLSEPTIRSAKDTGIVSSMRTAIAISKGSGGKIDPMDIVQPDAKGIEVYARDPAKKILDVALSRKTTVTAVLNSIGLSAQDLWIYMNADSEHRKDNRHRVETAMRLLQNAPGDAS